MNSVTYYPSLHIAWIAPNTSDATRSKLDEYLVSIDRIEKDAGEFFQTIDKDENLYLQQRLGGYHQLVILAKDKF